MSLYSIDIENFRGIPNLKISDFKKINLLVGKNNCGKTSVLEAIFLSIGVSNPQLAINIDNFRGILHDEKDDFHFIFHNLDTTKRIEINTRFLSPSQYRKLFIKPIYQYQDINIELNQTSEISASSTLPTEKRISGINLEFSVKTIPKAKDKFQRASIEFKPGGLQVKQAKGYFEKYLGVFLNTMKMAQELYTRLDKIIQKKAEKKLIKTLNVIDPRIIGISLGSKNMIYFDLGLERLIPIQLMGDGVSRLLSILVTIANYENGIVLIDEIENGFHATTLYLLWNSIKDAALAYNVQIFATTHSLECVKTFSSALSSYLLGDELIRLYRLERSIANKFKTLKYNSEILQSSLESNWEIR